MQSRNLKNIFKEKGRPDKCFFNDKYCHSPEKYGDFPIVFGHIKPISKGGTITDVSNVIWLCERHNWIMGDKTLIELRDISRSIYKKLL